MRGPGGRAGKDPGGRGRWTGDIQGKIYIGRFMGIVLLNVSKQLAHKNTDIQRIDLQYGIEDISINKWKMRKGSTRNATSINW